MLLDKLQDEKKAVGEYEGLIKDLSTDESEDFMNEVGNLVFQSALMKYIAISSEAEVKEFEAFINLQVNSENFFEGLMTYPEFGLILKEEAQALNDEMRQLLNE